MKPYIKNLPSNLPSLIFFGGPLCALPYADSYSKKTSACFLAAGILPYLFLFFFPMKWSYHLGFNLFYNFAFALWHLKFQAAARRSVELRSWVQGLRMIPALLLLALPFSIILAGIDKVTSDWLWSSFIEVNFSNQDILKGITSGAAEFCVLVFLIALSLGRLPQKPEFRQLINIMFQAALCFLIISHLYRLLIDIPNRQTIEAGIYSSYVNLIRSEWISLVVYVSISLLIFQSRMRKLSSLSANLFFTRGLISLCLCLVGMAVHSGMAANYTLSMGREKEKDGDLKKAIYWYEKTLAQVDSEELKSYLQFRVGLLQRKDGKLKSARASFAKVILKHNKNKDMVQKARRFQKNLELIGDSGKKRKVIPGVEARTEYKSAYCVPNSLGLVLGYWDDKVGAKEIGAQITRLDEGSYITDEVYFSESRGFSHYVLPLRTREDIKKLLDEEIPVLAFIPGHVLALLGYDEILETYITYDVATFEIWDERGWSEFEMEWAQNYNTIGIAVPGKKEKIIKRLFGDSVHILSEAYLQYLISQVTLEPEKNIKNLKAASNKGLFFADWEYIYRTEKAVESPAGDSVVFNFLSRPGIYSETVLYYLQTLYITGQYSQIVEFMEFYRTRKSPTSGILSILAGSHSQLGNSRLATQILLSSGNTLELNLPSIEFLINQEIVRQSPMLSLNLAAKILAASPHELSNGENAELAYRLWRKYNPLSKENSSQHIETIYSYLVTFDPYSAIAIRDLEQSIGYLDFYEEDRRSKELWTERLSAFKANLESVRGTLN